MKKQLLITILVIASILWAFMFGIIYQTHQLNLIEDTKIPINNLKDYQLDITEDICYIYSGDRLVGKCSLDSNLIEQLIQIDNL